MCQKCNEALLAAAQASSMLARAAKDLYSINQQAEATILAKASAELFDIVKAEPGVPPNGRKESKTPGESPEADAPKRPRAFYVDPDTNIVYLHGVAIGHAVVISPQLKH